MQEIDKLITDSHTWIFAWFAPNQRIVFWNKFGMPKGELTRIGDFMDMPTLWWLDPEKNAKLEQARRDSSIKLEVGDTEDRYWMEYAKTAPVSTK
jgi:microcin C transport system substrate-binding protein